MKRALTAFAALIALGACATGPAFAGGASDDLSWVAVSGEAGPQILFGVPESDVVFVGLSCRPGAGKVELAEYDEGARSAPVPLVSGKVQATVAMSARPDEGVRSAALPAKHPLLAEFRRTGRLGGPGDARARDGYSAATTAERKEVARFFAACDGRAAA